MSEYPLKPTPPEPPKAPAPPPVLPYRSPRERVHENVFAAVPAMIGFFAAIGLSAGGFLLFASTERESASVKATCFFSTAAAFVVLFLIRSYLQQRFGFAGFGRGALIGTVLGMMALVPCAGLYVLSMLVK